MPPLLTAEVIGDSTAAEGTSAGQFGDGDQVVLLGISLNEHGLQYVPYVPIAIPRSTRSSTERSKVGDVAASSPAPKRARSASPIITGSMLVGERVIFFDFLLIPLFLTLFLFSLNVQ